MAFYLYKHREANCIQTYIQYIYRCALLKPSEPKYSVHCIYTLSIVQDICLGSYFLTIVPMKVVVVQLGLITAAFLSGGRGHK